jgi:hypothetical protein
MRSSCALSSESGESNSSEEAIKTLTDERRARRRLRWSGIGVGLLAVLAVSAAQGRNKKESGPPADLPGRVSSLAMQLYGQDLEDSVEITDEIQNLVVAHLEAWIANRSPNVVQVQREIESVFSKLRYPAYAEAAVFASPWKGEELIGAGYTLGWSDIWRTNVVVLFSNRNGHTQKVAFTPFVPRTDLHYLLLPPSASGDFRFIIYGSRLGKSHPRLTAALYSFDGKSLRSSWDTTDLFDGTLSAQGNEIVIRYLKEDEFISQTAEGHLPPRYQITYTVTPQGLELSGERVIPY